MGKKDNAPERNNASFADVYVIKGDGVAILRPERLRQDAQFVARLKRMRAQDIVSKG